MATRIRLARGGTHKRPYYRIVVADQRAPRDGKFIERIGNYDPLLTENKSMLDVARAEYWLGTGAIPSERVRKLMALHGIASMAATYDATARKPSAAAAQAPTAAATTTPAPTAAATPEPTATAPTAAAPTTPAPTAAATTDAPAEEASVEETPGEG